MCKKSKDDIFAYLLYATNLFKKLHQKFEVNKLPNTQPDLIKSYLDILDNVFSRTAACDHDQLKELTLKFEQEGGIEILEDIQLKQNQDLYTLAKKISSDYFESDETQNININILK